MNCAQWKTACMICIFWQHSESPAWIGCIFVGMETVCEIPATTEAGIPKVLHCSPTAGQLLKPFRRIFFAYVLGVRECASLHPFCFSDWPPSCGATPPLLDLFSDPNNICPFFLCSLSFYSLSISLFLSFSLPLSLFSVLSLCLSLSLLLFFLSLSLSLFSFSLSLLSSSLSLFSLSLSLSCNEYSNYYSQ